MMSFLRCAAPLLCLILLACGTADTSSTGNWPRSRAQVGANLGVKVDLLEGTAVPMARLLASSVVENLEKREIPATAQMESPSRYVLRGRAEYDPSVPKKPFVALIHWTLYGDNNEPVGTYVQGVKGTPVQWEFGDPRIIRRIGNNAAKPIAAMIRNDTDATQAARRTGTALLVRPVRGASGDGNETLQSALKLALREADFNVTEDPRQAGFVLSGLVRVSPLGNGQDRVRISWSIGTVDGVEMGVAVQENTVPAGSLSGEWGGVAGAVATAAVDGLVQILEGSRRTAHTDPLIQPRIPPNIPRMPGRAIPPPPG
ncbi:MAG: hypothetical protein RIB59_03460 [Rhodospirillales bacterium]